MAADSAGWLLTPRSAAILPSQQPHTVARRVVVLKCVYPSSVWFGMGRSSIASCELASDAHAPASVQRLWWFW